MACEASVLSDAPCSLFSMGNVTNLHFMAISEEVAAPFEQWITSTGDRPHYMLDLALLLEEANLMHCAEELAFMCSILVERCNITLFFACTIM